MKIQLQKKTVFYLHQVTNSLDFIECSFFIYIEVTPNIGIFSLQMNFYHFKTAHLKQKHSNAYFVLLYSHSVFSTDFDSIKRYYSRLVFAYSCLLFQQESRIDFQMNKKTKEHVWKESFWYQNLFLNIFSELNLFISWLNDISLLRVKSGI